MSQCDRLWTSTYLLPADSRKLPNSRIQYNVHKALSVDHDLAAKSDALRRHFDVVLQEFGQFGDTLEERLEVNLASLITVPEDEDLKGLQGDAVAESREGLSKLEPLEMSLLVAVKVDEHILDEKRKRVLNKNGNKLP